MKKIKYILVLFLSLFLVGCDDNQLYYSNSNIIIEDGNRVRTINDEDIFNFFDFSYSLKTTYSDDYYHIKLTENTYPDGSSSVATTTATYTLTPLKTGFVYYKGTVDLTLQFKNYTYKYVKVTTNTSTYYHFQKNDDNQNPSIIATNVSFEFDGIKNYATTSIQYIGTYKWSTTNYYDQYYNSYAYSTTDIINDLSVLDNKSFSNSNIKATYIDSGVSGDNSLKYRSVVIDEHNFYSYFNVSTSITPIISSLSNPNVIDYSDITFTTYDDVTGTLRRDGTYSSNSGNIVIKSASGTIDIYPDIVI